MKIRVNKNLILNCITNIQSITNKKTNLIVNSCVLIKALGSTIYIIATDFDISFEGNYEANVEKEGHIIINSKFLFEIIKDFPVEEIVIEKIEDRIIEIKCEKAIFKLPNIVDDFPSLPNIKNANFFINIKSFILKDLIEKITTIEYLEKEYERRINYLYGVSFEKEKENEIVMTSTDTKRFSIVRYNNNEPINYNKDKPILINKRALKEAGKFLDSSDDIAKIGISESESENNHFIIKKNNEILLINLLEGSPQKYNYEQYIKEDNNIEINKENFLMSLKRMSILTSLEENKALFFNFDGDTLFIKYKGSHIGESEESIDIKRKDKKNILVKYNHRNFTEILSKINEDVFILNIPHENYHCFIRGKSDESFLSTFTPIVESPKEEEN